MKGRKDSSSSRETENSREANRAKHTPDDSRVDDESHWTAFGDEEAKEVGSSESQTAKAVDYDIARFRGLKIPPSALTPHDALKYWGSTGQLQKILRGVAQQMFGHYRLPQRRSNAIFAVLVRYCRVGGAAWTCYT